MDNRAGVSGGGRKFRRNHMMEVERETVAHIMKDAAWMDDSDDDDNGSVMHDA